MLKHCFVDNGVLRLPILYSEVKDLDESAVTCLFSKVKDTSKTCVMSDHERRFPTNCEDVAYVVRELAEKRLQVPFVCTNLFCFHL